MTDSQCDVLILGAGAAGLMCAIEAGKRGKRVIVLEHNSQAGRKILISGGGRCNFTHLECGPQNFVSANPHFAKSALARYRPEDFVALVEAHAIPYHEKTKGQLFCDGSAIGIVDMLLKECAHAGVKIVLKCAVEQVTHDSGFHVESSVGTFSVPALVVATGGLSIPKMGASPLGYRIATQFGLRVRPCRPALTPLTFAEKDQRDFRDLAGVSMQVAAKTGSVEFRDKMLITHRGLSGPAILQISLYWRVGESIVVDLLPGIDLEVSQVKATLSEHLPHRFLQRWMELNGYPRNLQLAGVQELARLSADIHAWEVHPNGTEGFEKAEVTAGGIDTDDLSSKTMEAKQVRGLFFIGEVVDVTGQLGGFNFQWAWSSGFAAGQAV